MTQKNNTFWGVGLMTPKFQKNLSWDIGDL